MKDQKQLQHDVAQELEALTHEELKKIARLINDFYGRVEITY
jgi:hypothetical protein|tara:strand:- start:301 stop:426 length:126 start_codon:yes stop_codon:yes gene_type:complete